MIRFSCPGCGAVFSVGDDKAGKQGKCPKCQTPFTIPAAEAPVPAPPPPPPPPPSPASSNPFADLDEAPVKKKSASKADLDEDRPRKKSPSKSDDEDDDRPKKKSARRYEDDEDDAPPVKKKSRRDDDDYDDDPPAKKKARRDDDEDDAPPVKKKSRRDDDDYDDAPPKKKPAARDAEDDDGDDFSFDAKPKKKPSRAQEDDYEDDRPRKKSRSRRDEEDDYDDYDDRPRRKPKKSGLLLAAAILHIIAAAIYVPCGGVGLVGASWLGFVAGAADTTVRVGGDQVRFKGDSMQKANLAEAERLVANAGTAVTLLQVIFVLALIGGLVAIGAAVGGFTRKKWFSPISLAAGGAFALVALIYLVLTILYVPLAIGGLLLLVLLPGAYAAVVITAAVNRNVKRALS